MAGAALSRGAPRGNVMEPLSVSTGGSATIAAVTGAHVRLGGLEVVSTSPNSGTCSSVMPTNHSATATADWKVFEGAGVDNPDRDMVP